LLHVFEKLSCLNFYENPFGGSQVIPRGQADGHDELINGNYMLRRPKRSKIEVVAPEEEEEEEEEEEKEEKGKEKGKEKGEEEEEKEKEKEKEKKKKTTKTKKKNFC
jgi:hypothetical protein